MSQPIPSKAERLAEFFRRLPAAPPAADVQAAYDQLCDILNRVEDDLTDVPYDPSSWRTDQRIYPPQEDNRSIDPTFADTFVFRSAGHLTRIGTNGAIEIEALRGRSVVFSKPGRDGLFVGGRVDHE